MRMILHRRFEKSYAKFPLSVKQKFKKRRDLFLQNPYDPILRNHSLSGKWKGHNSIDITGDIRAIYYEHEGVVVFVAIGTHSELYE